MSLFLRYSMSNIYHCTVTTDVFLVISAQKMADFTNELT